MHTVAEIANLLKTEFTELMNEAGIPWDADSKRFGNSCGLFVARGICFRLLPKNPRGSKRVRRLRVQCPDCGAWVSAGKLGTHKHALRPMVGHDAKLQSTGTD